MKSMRNNIDTNGGALSIDSKLTTSDQIGDAGDGGTTSHSTSSGLKDPLNPETSALCMMVAEIRAALQTGNTNDLHAHLVTLGSWRRGDKDSVYNYWRVAQYVGETELGAINVLLSLAVEKTDEVDNASWRRLEDLCRLLTVCLCNKEIVYQLASFCPGICSVLMVAFKKGLDHQAGGQLACKVTGVLRVAVTVDRWRFAQRLVDGKFLDPLLERLGDGGLHLLSQPLLKQILHLLKSLLMCGQSGIFQYTATCINQLWTYVLASTSISELTDARRDADDHYRLPGAAEDDESADVVGLLRDFLQKLQLSTRQYDTAQLCAKYWRKNKKKKDLLSDCLRQPFLLIFCSWPACGSSNSDRKAFFRKCGACQCVRYCSRKCQENHWQTAHQQQCKLLAKRIAWLWHDL